MRTSRELAAGVGVGDIVDMVRVIGTLELGGAQLSALRLSRALRRHGIRTLRLLAGEATDGGLALAARYAVPVEVFAEPSGLQWSPSAAFADWLASRLRDADLVHAHMFGAWWAAARAIPDGVPLVASEHNAVSWPSGDHRAAAAAAAPRVDAFFPHGPAARAFAVQIGVPLGRLHEGCSAIEGLGARPLPGLASPRLTFTGRLREDKGPDVLVDALALLEDAPPAYLVGDGPLRELLRERLRRLGLSDRVLLPGWDFEPARYVAGSTVHVVPSREEAWSQSAVVALGLGVPVVGSAVEGLRCTLGVGRGLLVPSENPEALADCLHRVLAGERAADPAYGRAYAAAFTPAAVAATYAGHYARLVTRRPRTPRAGRATPPAALQGRSADPERAAPTPTRPPAGYRPLPQHHDDSAETGSVSGSAAGPGGAGAVGTRRTITWPTGIADR